MVYIYFRGKKMICQNAQSTFAELGTDLPSLLLTRVDPFDLTRDDPVDLCVEITHIIYK